VNEPGILRVSVRTIFFSTWLSELALRKITLPVIRDSEKKRVLVWGAMVFALVYFALGACPWSEPSYLPLTAMDHALPLMPWTLLIYLSDYAFILLVLLNLRQAEDFSHAFYRMIAGIVISFAIFLIFPTVYPRLPAPAEPFWSETFAYLHFLDRPTNCFPSLHVSMTLIAAASLGSMRSSWRWGAYLWALAICLSTLTTKQHYVWDVLGGMFVSMASVWFSTRVEFSALVKRKV